jgi:hypothetical protein
MTDAALYGSIWMALGLFAVGEIGRRPARARHGAAAWAWPASAIGALVIIAHVLFALHSVHGWSHASAMAATASQTQAVYGIAWGPSSMRKRPHGPTS